MKAYVNISRIITITSYTDSGSAIIKSGKLSELKSLTFGFNFIKLTGDLTESKFKKYEKVLIENGFNKKEIIEIKKHQWEGKKVHYYSLEFSKR